MTAKLSQSLGQQFYIENQAGAGGNLGMGAAARGDARRLHHRRRQHRASWSIRASTLRIPYDTVKDFAPVTVARSTSSARGHPVASGEERQGADRVSSRPIPASTASRIPASAPRRTCPARCSGDRRIWTSWRVPFGGSGPAIQSALAGHTPIALHGADAGGAAGQGGQASLSRGHHAEALAGAARCADAWPRPACPIRRRTRCSACWRRPTRRRAIVELLNRQISTVMKQPDVVEQARCARLRRDPQHAGRVHRAHQDRHREMGERHPGGEHQDRMNGRPAPCISCAQPFARLVHEVGAQRHLPVRHLGNLLLLAPAPRRGASGTAPGRTGSPDRPRRGPSRSRRSSVSIL